MISVKENLKVRNVIIVFDVGNGLFCPCPNLKKNHQKADLFSRLLDIPIWGTFYAMFTTDS